EALPARPAAGRSRRVESGLVAVVRRWRREMQLWERSGEPRGPGTGALAIATRPCSLHPTARSLVRRARDSNPKGAAASARAETAFARYGFASISSYLM